VQVQILHLWDIKPKEALRCQERLSKNILLSPTFKNINLIAGVDASYTKQLIIGGIAILQYPDLTLLDYDYLVREVNFPYIPGLLTFREGPVLVELFQKIKWNPDIIFFDGQGIAHPKRMGIATHMGLLLNQPTIGCAKSHLIGSYQSPGKQKGSYSLLLQKGSIIGAVLRTKNNVKPIFVSPGNGINLEKAIVITLSCTTTYRIPEPIRQAHLLVQKIKKDF
jgi:deoxyribonuclease V